MLFLAVWNGRHFTSKRQENGFFVLNKACQIDYPIIKSVLLSRILRRVVFLGLYDLVKKTHGGKGNAHLTRCITFTGIVGLTSP